MTPEAVEAAIDAGDVDACVALFADATETQRAAVAKRAVARLKALTAGVSGRLFPFLDQFDSDPFRPLGIAVQPRAVRAAQAAVLASASFNVLKKLGARAVPAPDAAYAVLAARRPPWVAEWAALALEQDQRWVEGHWPTVRRLVREGLCPLPRDIRYVDGMLATLPYQAHRAKSTLREILLDDPGLLDDEIWLIFETEPTRGALTILSNMSGDNDTFSWTAALVSLANEGRIPRSQLLEASLDALERGFPEARSRWFVHVHDALKPTAEERPRYADRYLGLLVSRNPSTVTFAVKALGAIKDGQALDPTRVVASIAPALQARARGTVMAALDLLDQAVRREPVQATQAALVATEALVHEAPDVHGAVLGLVERHGDPTCQELAALLRERAEAVAPSQRKRLDAWLGHGAAAAGASQASAPDEFAALEARALALEPAWAERAGVPAALEAARHGGGPIPAAVRGALDVPRLDPARQIKPVNDLDALVDLFSAVLESPDSPDDVERLLDGVSRLCDQRPDDFEARTAPLRARVEALTSGAAFEFHLSLLVLALQGLALSWTTGREHAIRYGDLYGYLTGLFARRVQAIARRAARREPRSLLSVPTHTGGWIDPRRLVSRRRQSAHAAPDLLDETLALLRLGPEHRGAALADAQGLEGEFGAALRYALGGSESIGPTAALWVAAARARAPSEDDPQVEQRHPQLGPDAGRAARYELLKKQPAPWSNDYFASLLIATDPPLPRAYGQVSRTADVADLPTVLLHDLLAHGVAADARWAATVWPLDREAFSSVGFERFAKLERAGLNAARLTRPYLEVFESDPLLRPMARLSLATALSSPNAEDSGLATDTLVAAIDDGRLDAQRLGETLHTLFSTSLVKLTRWARTLGDAARVSPLHAQVIAGALQLALVDDLTWAPKDLHTLLERLKELLIELGEPLAEPRARESLGRLTRSGKTGKLAQELLALKESADRAPQRAAALRALAHRIERAETWARWAAEPTPPRQ